MYRTGHPAQPGRSTAGCPAIVAGSLVPATGVWLMISAFLWERGAVGGFGATWNNFIVGVIVAGLAAFSLSVSNGERPT